MFTRTIRTYLYAGWQISEVEALTPSRRHGLYDKDRKFVAYQHGVTMNTNSEKGIEKLVDMKNQERLQYWPTKH